MNIYVGKIMPSCSVRDPGEDRGFVFEDCSEKGELDVLAPEGYAIFFLKVPYLVARVHRADSTVRIPTAVSDRHSVRGVDVCCPCVRVVLNTTFILPFLFACFLYPYGGSLYRRVRH